MFDPILLEARNPGPMTGAGSLTYLMAAERGTALLVDAGIGAPAHLIDLHTALKTRASRLGMVVVTHDDPDHISGARAIAGAHGGAIFAKYPRAGLRAPLGLEWRDLADGQDIRVDGEALTVLHTPGHAPDHIALWHEASGTVFSGDLVIAGSSVMIHASRGGDLVQYLASLGRLIALAPRRLLPAHGPPIDDPRAVLTAYIAHRELRERQVIAALEAGHRTVEAIAESIYDDLAPALMAAARETVRAHLEKLRVEGRTTFGERFR